MCTTRVIAATLALTLLAACGSQPSKEDIGIATGAVVGSRVGRNMDRDDHALTKRALDGSADGESTTWRNDATGIRYSVTPTRTYHMDSGGPCRDFTSAAQIDGRDEVIQGTACRQPDGTWKAV